MTVAPRTLYSWWLVPPADHPARDALASAIARYSSLTTPPAPVFPPHVTLAGAFHATPVDAATGARALAARVPACVGVAFDGVATGGAYHRAAYLTAARTGPLMAAGGAAADLAAAVSGGEGGHGGRGYEPHASLIYTDDAAAAAAAAAAAGEEVDLTAAGWTGGAVEVWRTEGGVEGWVCEASYEVHG